MDSSPGHMLDHRNFIFCIFCTHAPGNAHEILGQYDLYFINGSHFSFFTTIASPVCVVGHKASISHITDMH